MASEPKTMYEPPITSGDLQAQYQAEEANPSYPSTQPATVESPFSTSKPADTVWSRLGEGVLAGGYTGLNTALLGLPDFLVKNVGGSKSFQDLQDFKAAHHVASTAGEVLGLGAGAGLDLPVQAPAKLAQLAGKADIAAKLAKLSEASPLTQAALRSGTAGAIEAGTTGDIPTALGHVAIGTVAGGLAGKIANKNVQNKLVAQAEELGEYPVNYRLGKAGMSPADLQQGTSEAQRVVKAAAKQAGVEDIGGITAAGSARVSAAARKAAIDPIKTVIDNTIVSGGYKDPGAFSKLLAEKTPDEIRTIIYKANGLTRAESGSMMPTDKNGFSFEYMKEATASGIPPLKAFENLKVLLEQATQAVSRSGLSSMAKDIPEAAKAGSEVARKLSELGKTAAIGAGLGAGIGGASTIPEVLQGGTVEPEKVLEGAAGGLALAVSPKLVPTVLKVAAKVGPTALKAVTELPGGVTGAATRLAAESPQLVGDIKLPSVKPIESQKDLDLSAWNKKFDEIARTSYLQEKLKNPNIVPYADWFDSRIGNFVPNFNPETIARAELGILSDRDREAILKDYEARKQLKKMDMKHLLKAPSLLDSILETGGNVIDPNNPNKLRRYNEDELTRILLAPKPGSVVSPQSKIQLNKDLDMIRRSGMSQPEKEAAFNELLKNRYGYNPEYLSRLGLGE